MVDGESPPAGAGGLLQGEQAALLLSPHDDIAEIEALANSAGMRVVRTFVQRIGSPNPKFYLGEGKVEQITRFIKRCAGKEKKSKP